MEVLDLIKDDLTEEEIVWWENRIIYWDKIHANSNRIEKILTRMLDLYCGELHPFRIFSTTDRCYIMVNSDGRERSILTLNYDMEYLWSNYENFSATMDAVIRSETLNLSERKFVSPKNQMKPFLTPMQEVYYV